MIGAECLDSGLRNEMHERCVYTSSSNVDDTSLMNENVRVSSSNIIHVAFYALLPPLSSWYTMSIAMLKYKSSPIIAASSS
jgi:hypothetical protein